MRKFDTTPSAQELVDWLAGEFHGLEFPATLRNRVAASCFAVTQEHHRAVVICLQQAPAIYPSAFALVRVQYEAYVRGMWLSLCATDEDVDTFSNGKEPPKMPILIAAIDAVSDVAGQGLSGLYKKNWNAMCAYAHTGMQQVQRWITCEAIEPNYDPEEVKEVLAFTSSLALLSAVSVASLANNHQLAQRVLEKSGIAGSP